MTIRRKGLPLGAANPQGTDGGSRLMPGTAAILETHGLTMDFRGFRALDDVDLRIAEGKIHAIIGPNGAGKTTLFNLLSGLLSPTGGRIVFGGREITGRPPHQIAQLGIARSFQITSVFPYLTLLDNLRLALQCCRASPARSG